MPVKQCHQCGTEWNREGAVGFNHTCEKCGSWIHSCKNCKYLLDGKCRNELAEKVSDLVSKNFCEEFRFREKEEKLEIGRGFNGNDRVDAQRRANAKEQLRKLWGD
ncbi:MAG: hypothetical protein HYY93_07105 [Planctomycetes bacterium]|nr:hypothetical protein [Planctomycetota bacterium]